MFKLLALLLLAGLSCGSSHWPDHDISTLKLLQIVHRHGDRSPIDFKHNDPYKSADHWTEGIGELTTKGKYRMYKRGQFIRQEYDSFLGDKHSPREVYVRSSLTDRCIESVSCLLSGAYPPTQKSWQWNNGSDPELGHIWQPFPIQTFMPGSDDLVLEMGKHCPAVSREDAKIWTRQVIHDYLNSNKDFLANLTKATGTNINDIFQASALQETLSIEMSHDYYWDKVWTKEEEQAIDKRLIPAVDLKYRNQWDSPVIQKMRAGGLVRELNNNIEKVRNNDFSKKLYVYSTHDSQVGVLMSALGIFNGRQPPFGATLYLELHQTQNKGHFVRAYYHNETDINSEAPHSIGWTVPSACSGHSDCPFEDYLTATKKLMYNDFTKECN